MRVADPVIIPSCLRPACFMEPICSLPDSCEHTVRRHRAPRIATNKGLGVVLEHAATDRMVSQDGAVCWVKMWRDDTICDIILYHSRDSDVQNQGVETNDETNQHRTECGLPSMAAGLHDACAKSTSVVTRPRRLLAFSVMMSKMVMLSWQPMKATFSQGSAP